MGRVDARLAALEAEYESIGSRLLALDRERAALKQERKRLAKGTGRG